MKLLATTRTKFASIPVRYVLEGRDSQGFAAHIISRDASDPVDYGTSFVVECRNRKA